MFTVAFPHSVPDLCLACLRGSFVGRLQDKIWEKKRRKTEFCLPGALHIKIEEGTEGSRDERMGDKLCLRMERWNMDKWING